MCVFSKECKNSVFAGDEVAKISYFVLGDKSLTHPRPLPRGELREIEFSYSGTVYRFMK